MRRLKGFVVLHKCRIDQTNITSYSSLLSGKNIAVSVHLVTSFRRTGRSMTCQRFYFFLKYN